MPATRISCLTSLLLLALCPGSSPGQTTLSIDVGWGSVYRQGRWNPVFITASDVRAREIEVMLYVPQTAAVASVIQQTATIGSTPTTFAVYAPLASDLSRNVVTLRDAKTHRWLASRALGSSRKDPRGEATQPVPIAPDTHLIAISGRVLTSKTLQSQLTHPRLTSGFIPHAWLPFHAIAYDSIDILMLNAPDLTKLSFEQQDAMVSWIRAGGKLVMWPGQEPTPLGPLVEALPCRIGEAMILVLPEGKLAGRKLTPASEAQTFTLFKNSGPNVYRRMLGLGTITLLSADVSSLRFDEAEAKAFWTRILEGIVPLQTKPDIDPKRFYEYTEDPRRSRAQTEAVTWAGNLPAVSTFDFAQIALALMGLLLIAGPIDSIVLKQLGHAPWTRITTAGWIGLILLTLAYGVYRAGDQSLHFRSVQLIDEADGHRVASNQIVGLSSCGGLSDINFGPETWWTAAMNSSTKPQEIPFRQEQDGNRLAASDTSTTQLLEGQTFASASGIIDGSIHRTADKQLAGTLTNRGASPLRGIRIRTSEGTWRTTADVIAPAATIEFSTAPDRAVESLSSRAILFQTQATSQPSLQRITNLNFTRAMQIDQLLRVRNDLVCIYAEFSQPPQDVELKRAASEELHVGVIRALVRIAPTTQPGTQPSR